jgi:hypothetical protein
MDLQSSVTYRGLNLNSVSVIGGILQGMRLDEARIPPVQGFGYSEKRSLADGYDFSKVFLGLRTVYLRGTMYALTRGELSDKQREFRAAFTPTLAYAADPANRGFLPLDFNWVTDDIEHWPTGIIPVRLYVRPDSQPGAFFPREAAYGVESKGYSSVFETQCVARDPRYYLQTPVTVAANLTSKDSAVVNKGDYPSPVNLTLGLNAGTGGPRTLTLTGFGSKFTVTIPNGANERIVRVDSQLKVCTLEDNGSETLRMDLIEFFAGYTWPQAVPGSNEYDWSTTGGAPDSGSEVWFREAFA